MKRPALIAMAVMFVLIGGVGGGLAWYKSKPPSSHGGDLSAPAPSAVEIVEARELTWQPTAELVGTALALRSVMVSVELPGTITHVHFESGSVVEEGTVLLSTDDSADRADLEAAQSGVRVAEASVGVADARLKLAHTEATRLAEALRLKATSEMDLDRAHAELDRAKADRDRLIAEVDLARAKVLQVKTRLDKRTIRAPFRARVGLRNVHQGQYLAEGASVVMLQEVADTIYLDFAIPQEYIARVPPGTVVVATSTAPGAEAITITVVAIDATVNNETRNVRVRSIVNNPGERLRPGMFVQIRVPVDEARKFVAVPSSAVRRASYSDQVFVIVQTEGVTDGTSSLVAKQRYVKLGASVGENVIVLDGLKAGERVASSGSFKLRDGAHVTPSAGDARK